MKDKEIIKWLRFMYNNCNFYHLKTAINDPEVAIKCYNALELAIKAVKEQSRNDDVNQ